MMTWHMHDGMQDGIWYVDVPTYTPYVKAAMITLTALMVAQYA